MRGNDEQQLDVFSYVSPEQRVPQDHPLRPLRVMADEALRELQSRFNRLYAKTGRPSITAGWPSFAWTGVTGETGCPTPRGVRSVGIPAAEFKRFFAPASPLSAAHSPAPPITAGGDEVRVSRSVITMQLVAARIRCSIEPRRLAVTNEHKVRGGWCPPFENRERWDSRLSAASGQTQTCASPITAICLLQGPVPRLSRLRGSRISASLRAPTIGYRGKSGSQSLLNTCAP